MRDPGVLRSTIFRLLSCRPYFRSSLSKWLQFFATQRAVHCRECTAKITGGFRAHEINETPRFPSGPRRHNPSRSNPQFFLGCCCCVNAATLANSQETKKRGHARCRPRDICTGVIWPDVVADRGAAVAERSALG